MALDFSGRLGPAIRSAVLMSPSQNDLLGAIRLLRKSGGELTVVVEGRSMAPLWTGPSRVRVECGEALRYHRGAIVLFLGERGRMVAHRVVAVGHGGGYLITRGDNNLAIDRPVRADQILGVVRGLADAPDYPRADRTSGGILWRLELAIAQRHFRLAWLIASISIFFDAGLSRVRKFLRLSR